VQDDLYANLKYRVLEQLDVSIAEYFYLDMVHQLSHNRWCTKSVEDAAKNMRITARGLQKMRTRLIDAGFIKRNIKGHLKTTEKYFDIITANKSGVNKVRSGVNKVRSGGEQSSYKNNKRNTENTGMTAKEVLNRFYVHKKSVLPSYVLDERA
jgi:hypothetical protein